MSPESTPPDVKRGKSLSTLYDAKNYTTRYEDLFKNNFCPTRLGMFEYFFFIKENVNFTAKKPQTTTNHHDATCPDTLLSYLRYTFVSNVFKFFL